MSAPKGAFTSSLYGIAKAMPRYEPHFFRSLFSALLSRPLHALQVHTLFRHFVERRQFAQTQHGFDHAVAYVIDLGFGVESSDAEANRTVCQIVAGAESFQNVRGLERRRGARRSAGNRDI